MWNLVVGDAPCYEFEQMSPPEFCESAGRWRVNLKLTVPTANLQLAEWGCFNREEGFNGVVGNKDITDPTFLSLDPRVWRTFDYIRELFEVTVRYEWLREATQLDLIVEGGEQVEKFQLDAFRTVFLARMSELS